MGKLFVTDTILRDAHQSLAATRMTTKEMLPACEMLDAIGYWSLEVWGGATFDSCLRYLNEDPWERLRTLRKALPNTKLQMLFRGQNILGYKHYADDVVEQFCRKAIENGIDVIRIFDALNDPRNLEAAIKSTKKYGGFCETALVYGTHPKTVAPERFEAECGLSTHRADFLQKEKISFGYSWSSNYPNHLNGLNPVGCTEGIGKAMVKISAERLARIFKMLKEDEEVLKMVEDGIPS